jgi:autotransporter-associated beta strand protein
MKLRLVAAASVLAFLAPAVHAQILITGTTPVVESFNTLSGLNLPAGWQMSAAGAGASANWDASGNVTTVTVNHTSSDTIPAAGRIFWNYLNGSGATQSVGFYTSGSYASSNAILARYQNSTNDLITALKVDYSRDRRITRTDSTASGSPTFEFSYSTDGTNWTRVATSDTLAWNSFWLSAVPGSGGTALSSAAPTANISGLQVPPGGSIYLRWNVITLHSGVHWGFGLNNVATQVTGSAPVPFHYWLGDDTTRGGAGIWTNGGGTAWSEQNLDGGPGVPWNSTRTAVFGGNAPSEVTVSGTVTASKGMNFLQTGSVLSGGSVLMSGANRATNAIDTPDSVTVVIDTNLTGTSGFTKTGLGSLIVNLPLGYTGGTDINGGSVIVAGAGTFTGGVGALGGGDVSVATDATLLLSNNQSIGNDAALRLATNGRIDLGFSPGAEEVVGDLFLNGVAQADGTYGATGSGAGTINDAYFSGTGLLRVGVPPPIPTALFWVGDDSTRGDEGTWSNTGGTAWAIIDADIPGGAWDSAKTAVFGGAEPAFATLAGEIAANRGIWFRTSGSTVQGSDPIVLGGATQADNLITVDNAVAATIQAELTGATGITKTGRGSLILSGVMGYTGGTAVNEGTLVVSSNGALGAGDVVVSPTVSADSVLLLENNTGLPDDAALRLNSAAGFAGKVDLGFAMGAEEVVGSLFLNGVAQAEGTYGASGSGADVIDNTYFSGSGRLRVGGLGNITVTGTLAALGNVYGSPSGTTSFSVSATGLTAGITITPPVGFEVSPNASFASDVGSNLSPIIVGAAGDVSATTIHVRLAPLAAAGSYSGNIVLSSPGAGSKNVPTVSSTVTPKPLSITPPLIASRPYDGSTTPGNVTVGVITGLVGSETLTVTGIAAAFPSKNVGAYPGLTVSYLLGNGTNGGLANNYSLAPGSASASIIAKPAIVAGFTAGGKIYDGNTSIVVTGTATLSGMIGVEDVTLNGTPTFAFTQAGVGNAIPIAISGLSLGGADAGNYTLSLPNLTADITQATQTITFDALPAKTTADAPFALTATASSGLAVSYTSSDPLVAEIRGSTVTIKAGGSTVITASQSGNANFSPAADVPQTLTVNATFAGQFDFEPHDGAALSFDYNGTAIPNVTVSPMTITGMSSSNNNPNLQGVWPNTGALNASGAALADLAGSPNQSAYFEFTLTAAPGFALGEPKLRFGVGRDLNGPRQFQWRSSADGFVNRMTISQLANDGGLNALPPPQNFSDELRVDDVNFFDGDPIGETVFNEVVSSAADRSSITFRFYGYGAEANNTTARLTRFLNFLVDVSQATATVPSAPLIIGIIPNDGELRVSFTPPPGDVTGYEYTLDGGENWITTSAASPFTIAGLINGQTYQFQLRAINATGTGDASPVRNATPQPNTLTGLAATDTRTLNGGTYALTATASSGLPVSYESSNTSVATVSGGNVTIAGPGITTFTARQAGGGDFDPAVPLTQTLTVLPSGWTLMENFEARTPGDLNGQNNWSVVVGTPGGTGTTTVTADPADAGNKVAMLNGTHTAANRFMSSLSPTETFTVFKRFRIDNIDSNDISSGESHLNMGVSNLAAPGAPGDFSLHTSVTPTVTTPFRIRHTPESAPTNVTVNADLWYSSWYVVDNSTGKFKLYIQGGAQTSPVLAADGAITDGLWNFRNAGAITSARIYLRTLANHNAPAFIDDIYFAPGEMLGLPADLSPSFANWAAAKGLSGDPNADFDKDGLVDAFEYVLGNNPRGANANAPQSARGAGGELIFTFLRDDESEAADMQLALEAGTDLVNWPLVFKIAGTSANSDLGVQVEENGAAPDLITITVPDQGAGLLFGRLRATVSSLSN